MTLALSLGITSNPRTWPVIDGRAMPEGIALGTGVMHAGELFFRQLHDAEFDLSEMSFSSLIMIMAKGDDRWLGLPIFTTRYFFHTMILVRKAAGIGTPADGGARSGPGRRRPEAAPRAPRSRSTGRCSKPRPGIRPNRASPRA